MALSLSTRVWSAVNEDTTAATSVRRLLARRSTRREVGVASATHHLVMQLALRSSSASCGVWRESSSKKARDGLSWFDARSNFVTAEKRVHASGTAVSRLAERSTLVTSVGCSICSSMCTGSTVSLLEGSASADVVSPASCTADASASSPASFM